MAIRFYNYIFQLIKQRAAVKMWYWAGTRALAIIEPKPDVSISGAPEAIWAHCYTFVLFSPRNKIAALAARARLREKRIKLFAASSRVLLPLCLLNFNGVC